MGVLFDNNLLPEQNTSSDHLLFRLVPVFTCEMVLIMSFFTSEKLHSFQKSVLHITIFLLLFGFPFFFYSMKNKKNQCDSVRKGCMILHMNSEKNISLHSI